MQRFMFIAKALGKSGMPLPVVILLFLSGFQAQTSQAQIIPGSTTSEYLLGGGIAAVLLYYLIQLVKVLRPQKDDNKTSGDNISSIQFAQMLKRFDSTMTNFSSALGVIAKDHADMLRHDGMILTDTGALKTGQGTIINNQETIQRTLDGPTGIVSMIKDLKS